jgi:phosphoribosylformylglycinamidine (FGAM) synthase-like amidotransferase family enzyme
MINLNNDWLRRELGTTASTGDQIITRYYGYSNTINGADTDDIWSIRKVTLSAGVESVSWSDNNVLSFNAKWSERSLNFISPTSSLGFTYSSGQPTNFTWNSLAGVNTYNIIVKDSNGYIVSKNGTLSSAGSNQTITERYLNKTNHIQYFQSSGAYSVVLQAVNAGGTLTATYSVQV